MKLPSSSLSLLLSLQDTQDSEYYLFYLTINRSFVKFYKTSISIRN